MSFSAVLVSNVYHPVSGYRATGRVKNTPMFAFTYIGIGTYMKCINSQEESSGPTFQNNQLYLGIDRTEAWAPDHKYVLIVLLHSQ